MSNYLTMAKFDLKKYLAENPLLKDENLEENQPAPAKPERGTETAPGTKPTTPKRRTLTPPKEAPETRPKAMNENEEEIVNQIVKKYFELKK
jgi:hypothetical protein